MYSYGLVQSSCNSLHLLPVILSFSQLTQIHIRGASSCEPFTCPQVSAKTFLPGMHFNKSIQIFPQQLCCIISALPPWDLGNFRTKSKAKNLGKKCFYLAFVILYIFLTTVHVSSRAPHCCGWYN